MGHRDRGRRPRCDRLVGLTRPRVCRRGGRNGRSAVSAVPTGRARLSIVRIVDLHDLHVLRRIAEQSAGVREAAVTIQAAHLRTHLPRPPSDRTWRRRRSPSTRSHRWRSVRLTPGGLTGSRAVPTPDAVLGHPQRHRPVAARPRRAAGQPRYARGRRSVLRSGRQCPRPPRPDDGCPGRCCRRSRPRVAGDGDCGDDGGHTAPGTRETLLWPRGP
jgi:hypothetical protein